MTSQDQVQKHMQAFNRHDADAWAADYAEDAVLYDPQYEEPKRGREAVRKDISDFFSAFPDMQFETRNIMEGGDGAAIQGTGTGTQTGAMEGPQGTLPATNRRVQIEFAAFVRLNPAGLIAEERRYYDMAGMMTQLGVMPTPEARAG